MCVCPSSADWWHEPTGRWTSLGFTAFYNILQCLYLNSDHPEKIIFSLGNTRVLLYICQPVCARTHTHTHTATVPSHMHVKYNRFGTKWQTQSFTTASHLPTIYRHACERMDTHAEDTHALSLFQSTPSHTPAHKAIHWFINRFVPSIHLSAEGEGRMEEGRVRRRGSEWKDEMGERRKNLWGGKKSVVVRGYTQNQVQFN